MPPAPRDGSPRSGYILFPHTTLDPKCPQIPENEHQPVLVTDMWIERCLYRKQFEEPQARVTNTPFLNFPIPGFQPLTVCSTGFQGIDLVHMSKTVVLMGASYDEFFTPKASVLLCSTVILGHEKLIHAQLWGVPAVKSEWLWDCVRRGEFTPFEPYLVQPAESPISQNRSKSRKSEKAQESNVVMSKRHNKKALPAFVEEGKRLANDTPSSSEQVQVVDPNPWSSATRRPAHSKKKQSPDTNSTGYKEEAQDTDTSNDIPQSLHINPDSESSHTLRPASGPLHEISPNTSQSKRSTSPEKIPEPSASAQNMPSPQKPGSASSSSLGPAISSLLAHHQRASTNPKPPTPSSSEQQHPYRRRRRQLLGRAPSNLSSSHSINLSRASSVDTMNTDGLGTPLESSNNVTKPENNTRNTKNNNNNNSSNNNNSNITTNNADPNSLWTANADHDADHNEDPQPLQMTQLGYEDETVRAWRERVDVKMGVAVAVGHGKEKEKATKGKGTPGKGGARSNREGGDGGGLGISRRTRLATGAGGLDRK